MLSQKLPGVGDLSFSSFLKEASMCGYIFRPSDGLLSKCEDQNTQYPSFNPTATKFFPYLLIMEIDYYWIVSQLNIFAKLKKKFPCLLNFWFSTNKVGGFCRVEPAKALSLTLYASGMYGMISQRHGG